MLSGLKLWFNHEYNTEEKAIKDVLIFFDTNVLLDLYTYSEDTISSVLKTFPKLEKFSDLVMTKGIVNMKSNLELLP